jgi:hypothetical protein
MSQTGQTYANHTRFDPPFHFFLAPVLLANFIYSLVLAARHFTLFRGWAAVMAFALLLLAMLFRMYSLKVQDRVIRLEERIRLSMLLPPSLQTRITELTTRQLVALRFASDAEVPALVERTLTERLEPKQIKQAITSWRPDYERV